MKNRFKKPHKIFLMAIIAFTPFAICLSTSIPALAAGCTELKINPLEDLSTSGQIPIYYLDTAAKEFKKAEEKTPSNFPNPLILKDCGHKKYLAWEKKPETYFIEKVRVKKICAKISGSINDGSNVAGAPGSGSSNNCNAKN